MAARTARETYHFEGDQVWVDEVTATFPNNVSFIIDVPVVNPEIKEESRQKINAAIKKNLNNSILRIGRSRGAKGKPSMTSERKLKYGGWIEKNHDAKRSPSYNA